MGLQRTSEVASQEALWYWLRYGDKVNPDERDREILEPDPRVLVTEDLELRVENGLWTVWLREGRPRRSKRIIDVGFPTCIEAESSPRATN